MKHNNSSLIKTLSLVLITTTIATTSSLMITPSVLANCAGSVGDVATWQAPLQRHWQALQQQTDYPWGQARPYDTIVGDRITFTPDFERLNGPQKQQGLDLLLNPDWSKIITPAEQEAASGPGGFGFGFGPLPHSIYASDGRLLSAAYDGCTRFTTLTEQARYSWYYNSIGRILPTNSDPEALRNAGRPAWRQVRFSIAAAQERNVRLRFWRTVGYNRVAQGFWIAWVPEQGHFEVNVPPGYDIRQLRRFREAAPSQYRYVVVTTEGTRIGE
jgi:hypothetical protein